MTYEEMSLAQLRATAKELGVLPPGRPTKKELLSALEPGGPPKEVIEQTVSQQLYQFDRIYIVQKSFGGYEVGDKVINLSRALGLALVEQGKIRLDKNTPAASNPNAIERRVPQT